MRARAPSSKAFRSLRPPMPSHTFPGPCRTAAANILWRRRIDPLEQGVVRADIAASYYNLRLPSVVRFSAMHRRIVSIHSPSGRAPQQKRRLPKAGPLTKHRVLEQSLRAQDEVRRGRRSRLTRSPNILLWRTNPRSPIPRLHEKRRPVPVFIISTARAIVFVASANFPARSCSLAFNQSAAALSPLLSSSQCAAPL